MPKIVIGWDPGRTTGVCAAMADRDRPSGFRVLESTIVEWPNRFSRIRGLIELYRPTTTIIERFVLYKHAAKDQVGSEFPSSQVIGIIEAYLFMTGLAMPIYQGAYQIAGKPPVQILEEHAGILGHTEHHKDAYKHVRYWFVQQQLPPPVKPTRRWSKP